MKAYTVVGPTNLHRWRRSSFDNATEAGEVETGWGGGRMSRPLLVAPSEGRQRAPAVLQFHGSAGVVDGGFDLASVPDDPRVPEQSLHVAVVEPRDPIEIEALEGCAEILAFDENRAPTQARLEALQAQLLVQSPTVCDGKAPFRIVVVEELGGRNAQLQRDL